MVAYVPDEDEVRSYFQRLSNWGRWGDDDELGTLNLITPQKRVEAVHTVREGISVGCAAPIAFGPPAPDVAYPPLHFMIRSGESTNTLRPGAVDFIGLVFHGLTITHLDALGHSFWDGKMYNDRPGKLINSELGATVLSVETMQHGIMTRGVLLDIAELKGRLFMDAGEPIFPEDLEAAEQAQGVTVGEGDALLVRTGWYKSREERGPHPVPRERPGLHAATLPWLHARGVALVAADAGHDVTPSGYEHIEQPVHEVGQVAMGISLIDACQFEDLKAACTERSRWEFLFMVAPIRIRYGTGAPVNPLAVF